MKESAGIVMYRHSNEPEFFLVHPGGPFFRNKNEGWWTIPKGEPATGEDLLATALREFREETGYTPAPPFTPLAPIIQKGGKKVYAWASAGDVDPESISSNTFEMEWPPKSGKVTAFPEIDKAGWFPYKEACLLINERQRALLDEVVAFLGGS